MSVGVEVDLRELIVSDSTFGPGEIVRIRAAISADGGRLTTMRDAVADLEAREDRTPARAVRLGVCYYLLGRYDSAIRTLKESDSGALSHFYMAKSYMAKEDFASAVTALEAAATAGYNSDDVALAKSEAVRRGGDPEGALRVLDELSGAVEQTAEYLYQRAATVSAVGGNPLEVVALLERAVTIDDTHGGALFGLAMENDRRGNDEQAIHLYERAAQQFPTHAGTLLNLGILYEDMASYDRAQQCYRRLLVSIPDDERARLFLRDVDASRDMFYDEEARREQDRLTQVLSVPVTDFELSVRSRNCLQKMGINTLGDLTRTSEQQLLASKNFGETSLVEIREMLSSKGLDLGQFVEEKRHEEPAYDPDSLSPDERALLDRPVADLNLSVRARKCMVRLGMTTIGELVRRTGDDLLECKNFGVTSLNEVREKLAVQNLKLRGD